MIALGDRDLRKRTAETFDRVSSSFDSARHGPWPSIREMGSLRGRRVLDLGAGTGRNSEHFLHCGAAVVAADVSMGMLETLRGKLGTDPAIDLVRCDASSLPFRDSVFDGVAFVAALHHIPGEAGRGAALGEVWRVSAEGGSVLVTVWSPQVLPKGAVRAEADGGTCKDVLIPWADMGERYYHMFSLEELSRALSEAGLSVERVYRERISRRGAGTNLVAVAHR